MSLKATGLACDLAGSLDQVEETASGSSGLQNLGDGYYQLNWKSPAGYANSCKTLTVDLGLGLRAQALFRFTR